MHNKKLSHLQRFLVLWIRSAIYPVSNKAMPPVLRRAISPAARSAAGVCSRPGQ